jgi:hypothetical protein
LLTDAQGREAQILDAEISFFVKNRMERLMDDIAENPEDLERMRLLEHFAAIVMPLPLGLNTAATQNAYWELHQKLRPDFERRAQEGDEAARTWLEAFVALGRHLSFAVDLPKPANALQAVA